MKYLLDTCIISETSRPRPDARVMEWIESVDESDLFVPAVVFGELRKGVERRNDDPKKLALTRWLDDCREIYGDRIVPFDYEVSNLWGKEVANLQRAGKTPPVIDSQIAATALCHGMTLVTRNVRDMADFAIQLLNPFQD